MIGRFLKNIALGAKIDLKRHDDGLAQGIYGRIGNLRKLLAEIIIQRALLTRQNRHRGIVTHRPHRLVTRLGKRSQHLITLLEAHLKHLLIDAELGTRQSRHLLTGKAALDLAGVLPQPLFVGLTRLQQFIDIAGMEHPTLLGIDNQNLSRPHSALGDDLIGRIAVSPHLGGERNKTIVSGHPAGWPQAIAIQ